jgi:flagellar basal body-associated protein FliL
MADEDKKKETKDSKKPRVFNSGFLQWIIMAAVVLICACSGLFLGRLTAGSPNSAAVEPSPASESTQPEIPQTEHSTENSGGGWYYELDPVVANLDEPGVTRYVRATITLEVDAACGRRKAISFFDQKKPVLTNWLTVYLASLCLEDVKGDRNLKRIQSEILSAFNETLFPDAEPQIKHVLFKEFAIQ